MVKKTVTVKNATGLHARPASLFTKLATSCKCEVYLEKEGKRVNAKSILGILSLAISEGSIVDILTDGEDEAASLQKLVDFVENLTE